MIAFGPCAHARHVLRVCRVSCIPATLYIVIYSLIAILSIEFIRQTHCFVLKHLSTLQVFLVMQTNFFTARPYIHNHNASSPFCFLAAPRVQQHLYSKKKKGVQQHRRRQVVYRWIETTRVVITLKGAQHVHVHFRRLILIDSDCYSFFMIAGFTFLLSRTFDACVVKFGKSDLDQESALFLSVVKLGGRNLNVTTSTCHKACT